jgi:hypothetical protein
MKYTATVFIFVCGLKASLLRNCTLRCLAHSCVVCNNNNNNNNNNRKNKNNNSNNKQSASTDGTNFSVNKKPSDDPTSNKSGADALLCCRSKYCFATVQTNTWYLCQSCEWDALHFHASSSKSNDFSSFHCVCLARIP